MKSQKKYEEKQLGSPVVSLFRVVSSIMIGLDVYKRQAFRMSIAFYYRKKKRNKVHPRAKVNVQKFKYNNCVHKRF